MAKARIATRCAIHGRFMRDANLYVILVARSLPQIMLSYLSRNVCSHQNISMSFLPDNRIFFFHAVTDSLLNDLAQEVGSQGWEKLGRALGLSFQALNRLRVSHRTDNYRAKAIFNAWKEKHKDNATEESLQTFLNEAQMYHLWKKVKGKHSKYNCI